MSTRGLYSNARVCAVFHDHFRPSRGGQTIQYASAKVKLRPLFPDATRIEINPQRLNVKGLPLPPLPTLAHVLKVLTKVWGDDTNITTDFSSVGEMLPRK